MAKICEHEFERPNSKNPDYSQMEYDLYAKLNMTIRKNLRDNRYEIIDRNTKEVLYTSKTLEGIVKIANQLEGEENTVIECGIACPERR